MKCSEARDLISPYLDGMLKDKESMMLEKHLISCPTCKNYLLNMQEACQILNSLEHPGAPLGFAYDFHQRLQKEPLLRKPYTDKDD